jgi:VanZ family protein
MRLRVVLAVIWTIVILMLCWTPQTLLPVNEGTASLTQRLHLDKFVHAGIFTVFSVLWLRTRPTTRSRYLWVFLAGTALAAITEIVQNLPIINREGEFEDFMADFVGVLFGLALFHWMAQKLRSRNISR